MKLLVISPEDDDARELPALPRLVAAGLAHYHVRKPAWPRERLAAWLHAVPAGLHPRLVLHTHHELAADFAVGGLHQRQFPAPASPAAPAPASSSSESPDPRPSLKSLAEPMPALSRATARPLLRSRAVHDLAALRAALDFDGRLLLSPLFPSISKPGHGHADDSRPPILELQSLLARPRRAEVCALGGVDATRLPTCRALGFDGVAALGAVWRAADPVRAFAALHAALFHHAPLQKRSPAPDGAHA